MSTRVLVLAHRAGRGGRRGDAGRGRRRRERRPAGGRARAARGPAAARPPGRPRPTSTRCGCRSPPAATGWRTSTTCWTGSAPSSPSGTPGSPSWRRALRGRAGRPRRRPRAAAAGCRPEAQPRRGAGERVTRRRRGRAPDGLLRCPWGAVHRGLRGLPRQEWGRPVHGDDALFERLCLEAFQSGLSWITILRRREGFRTAFAGFKIDAGGGVHRRRPGAAARRPGHHPQPRQDRRDARQRARARPTGPRASWTR